MVISINPWYYCNFSCSFCYLTEKQLRDKTLLSLDRIAEILTEISSRSMINHIDIYGGEVLLLPDDYLNGIKEIAFSLNIRSIALITNLSLVTEPALDTDFHLTISYDFGAREKSELVINNILSLPRTYSILTLASRKFLDTVSVDEFVETFNLLSGMNTVEIKPYSQNQANRDVVSYKEFEDFVWAVIQHPKRRFDLENEAALEQAFSDVGKNAFSDDHIYITPTGKIAVLEFDPGDKEFFLELDNLEAFDLWCVEEKNRVNKNTFCGECEFKGKCLSEHLRDVKTLVNSCNGFHGLLKLWEHENESPTLTKI